MFAYKVLNIISIALFQFNQWNVTMAVPVTTTLKKI